MSLYDHFSVCLLLMACFDVYSVSYECSCPGMRMTKPALCDRLMPQWHTHTHSSIRHTCSHHITSRSVWFFGLVSYQGTRRLLSKSAWILHYKVLKEVTKKKTLLSSAFTFQCIYTSCMWQHGCICALMYVLLTVTTGNHRLIIHTVGDRSSAMPSADTRSRLRGCR